MINLANFLEPAKYFAIQTEVAQKCAALCFGGIISLLIGLVLMNVLPEYAGPIVAILIIVVLIGRHQTREHHSGIPYHGNYRDEDGNFATDPYFLPVHTWGTDTPVPHSFFNGMLWVPATLILSTRIFIYICLFCGIKIKVTTAHTVIIVLAAFELVLLIIYLIWIIKFGKTRNMYVLQDKAESSSYILMLFLFIGLIIPDFWFHEDRIYSYSGDYRDYIFGFHGDYTTMVLAGLAVCLAVLFIVYVTAVIVNKIYQNHCERLNKTAENAAAE